MQTIQSDEKSDYCSGDIWKQFEGSRIVLSGVDGPEYQAFFQSLVAIGAAFGTGFRVVDGVENAIDGDFVLIFARPFAGGMEAAASEERGRSKRREQKKKDPDSWDMPFEEPNLHHTWNREPGSWKRADEYWNETVRLLTELRELSSIRPKAVLVLSGNEVYGTCFGRPHPFREEELGYVSHTDSRDAAAQCMRVAEHMACCLAQQNGLHVSVARLGRLPEAEQMLELLEYCARILLLGESSEIYNLPDFFAGEKENWKMEPEIADLYNGYPSGGRQRKSIETRQSEKDGSGETEHPMKADGTEGDADAEPVKIVRFPGIGAAAKAEKKQAQLMRETDKRSEAADGSAEWEEHSPLAALEIKTDTEKVERLGR